MTIPPRNDGTSVIRTLLLACMLILVSLPAVGSAPSANHAAPRKQTLLEDRSGRALDSLHAALHRARKGKGQARLVFLGASHTASDLFTGVIRRGLQRRYGDAGHGHVLPAKPWRWYRHSDVNIQATDGWRPDRLGQPDSCEDGLNGIAGVSLSSSSAEDSARVWTSRDGPVGRRASLLEVWYLVQPAGGSFQVLVDDRPVRIVSTAGPEPGSRYAEFKVADRGHSIEIRPVGDGEVRLFGVVLERRRHGVVLDTLGVPGARAADILSWNPGIFRDQLARRKPDLFALAYGTNEAGDDDVPIEDYEASLREVLARFREVAPDASCLLIGPSDRPMPLFEGGFGPRPRTSEINDVQRRVAGDTGCAYLDLIAFMGGEMSMVQWVNAKPPLASRDHVHFTRLGYERLGEALLKALLPKSPSRKPKPRIPAAPARSSPASPKNP
jgi:lysophospholipase L1-like esterase